MVETIATIRSVSTTTTKNGNVLYFVTVDDGTKFKTFKNVVGEKARSLEGQAAVLVYTEQQNNPAYPADKMLDSVRPQTTTVTWPTTTAATATTSSGTTVVPMTTTGGGKVAFSFEQAKDARIARQNAVKAAAALIPTFPADEQTLDTLFRLSDAIAAYTISGVFQGQSDQSQPVLGQTSLQGGSVPF